MDGLPEPVLVIANPAAAGVTATEIDKVVASFGPCHPTVCWTDGPGHAKILAAEHAQAGLRGGVVVAVGGDGTVSEVVQALARNGPDGSALLALPLGSGNSVARNLWGDAAWPDVVAAALDRRCSGRRLIDLLELEEPGRVAVLGASSGFLPAVLVAAAARPEPRGLDRYRAASLSVLAAMPDDPTLVTVDGRPVYDGPASLVAVGGGRYRAQSLKLLPHSLLDDGLLDVCVLPPLDGDALGQVALAALTGEHVARPEVTYAQGRRVSIERTDGHPLLAEYDGDVWADARPSLTISVRSRALPVLAAREAPGG